jgi:hypothetical protein
MPLSAYSMNSQQQMQPSQRMAGAPITSPLMVGYSDLSSDGRFSTNQGDQFQNYSRADSRSNNSAYEPSNYPTSYSRTSDAYYNDNGHSTVTRERAVTLNMGNIQ